MKTQIRLKLYATLKRYTPESSENYLIDPDTTVEELIDSLGIPHHEVHLVMIDSAGVKLSTVLKGEERVSFFPPLGGG